MKQRPIAWFCCDTAALCPFFTYRPLKTDNMTGRTYLESGKPVRVLIHGNAADPRNVLSGRGTIFAILPQPTENIVR